MIHLSNIQLKHDSESGIFSATLEYCEPTPSMIVTDPITGEGETLVDALEELCLGIEAAEEDGQFA